MVSEYALLLVGTVLVALVASIAVTVLSMRQAMQTQLVLKSSDNAQALAIALYILPLSGLLASARWWVMAFALVITIITGIDYVYRALTLRRTSARYT